MDGLKVLMQHCTRWQLLVLVSFISVLRLRQCVSPHLLCLPKTVRIYQKSTALRKASYNLTLLFLNSNKPPVQGLLVHVRLAFNQCAVHGLVQLETNGA